jgi:hypothetical protein
MRILIVLIISAGLFMNRAAAQTCDVAQAGVKVYNDSNTDPAQSIKIGETANFRFSIKNAGNGCAIPAHSITAVFDFPTMAGGVKPYVYAGPPTYYSGYFTWTYNSKVDVLVGTNTREIPAGVTDLDITMRVRGNAAGAGNSNLNITQEKGVADNAQNNFGGARLVVTTEGVPAIRLRSFSGDAVKCNVSLKWSTLMEDGPGHFDIEFSPDGFSFKKIGTVNIKNIPSGADYDYSWTPSSEKGFYRLKQVTATGAAAYSNDVYVAATCLNKLTIQVYPNPVRSGGKLVINVTGNTGSLSAALFNVSGQKIQSTNLVSNVNEISLVNVAAGTYMLKVTDENGSVESYRVIVTR